MPQPAAFVELRKNDKTETSGSALSFFLSAPGMGNNLVVKVHYALGSRKR